MGRRKTDIWNHFDKIKINACKYLKGRCKYCSAEYTTNALRMRRHISKCKECPIEIRSKFPRNKIKSNSIKYKETQDVLEQPSTSQHFMDDSSVSILDKTEKDVLDVLLARSIFSSGTPFRLVENQCFQLLLNRLRPSYSIPTRKTLTTSLLNNEYNFVKRLVTEEINNSEFLTIMTDVSDSHVMNILLATPKPVFLKCIETGENSLTGEYISDVLFKVINEIGDKKITALVTDNARNMKCAWRIIQEKYPHLQSFGCAREGLNLLANAILNIPSISRVVTDAREVINVLKAKEILKINQKETRCLSVCNNMESLVKSKQTLLDTAVDRIIPNNIKPIMLDDDFWDNINRVICILKPICALINALQADSPRISSVLPGLKEIESSLLCNINVYKKSEQKDIMKIVEDRKESMLSDIHCAATQLDPKLMNTLTNEEEMTAITCIINLSKIHNFDEKQILIDLVNFKSHSDLWSRSIIWDASEVTEPLAWWKAFFQKTELYKIAHGILNIPPTSARQNSTSSNIKAKKRNRTEKQAYIMFNLKLFQDVDLITKFKDQKMSGIDVEEICSEENNINQPDSDSSEEESDFNVPAEEFSSDDESEIERTYNSNKKQTIVEDFFQIKGDTIVINDVGKTEPDMIQDMENNTRFIVEYE